MIQPVFFNGFQKGGSENANIGAGTFVGVETYSTKGVAKLTRDTVQVDGGIITALPVSCANNLETYVVQAQDGTVYISTDNGQTWSDITNPNGYSTGDGYGIVYFAGNTTPGYFFAFRGGNIEYLSSPYGAGDWSSSAWQTGLFESFASPTIFPNDGMVYFGNGNMVGKFGYIAGTPFNPAGTNGTDYFYTPGPPLNGFFGLILPSLYQVNCMSFLPYNYIALGTGSAYDSQVADIILWNPTVSTYETPLRLYSPAAEEGQNGVQQIINRNNILYAVTGGNNCVYETNGTNFSLVDELSLRTSWRTAGLGQASFPVFLTPQPAAIAVLGNKILTGSATFGFNVGVGAPYGLFPMGVWTLAFTNEGNSTQLEFTISTGTTRTSGFNTFAIGMIQPVSGNTALIGWQDNTSYGIDLITLDVFQTEGTVYVESPMFEVGTPLNPLPISNIEVYLVNYLLTGQLLSVYGRTNFADDYTFFQTFDPLVDGALTSYQVTNNPLGATKYLQLMFKMNTGAPVTKFTPQIRNVKIS